MNKPKINAFQAFYFVLMSNAAISQKQQTKTLKKQKPHSIKLRGYFDFAGINAWVFPAWAFQL